MTSHPHDPTMPKRPPIAALRASSAEAEQMEQKILGHMPDARTRVVRAWSG